VFAEADEPAQATNSAIAQPKKNLEITFVILTVGLPDIELVESIAFNLRSGYRITTPFFSMVLVGTKP
jgi:hypothetical protein